MSLLQTLAGGGVSAKTYVDDVFSAYTYTGNGSTQTITNGIDLVGEGGLLWTKRRDGANSHYLQDTVRGITTFLVSDTTAAQVAGDSDITGATSSGFTLGSAAARQNVNGNTQASWTFRKAPKFFDVVTYTGDGTSSRTISHSLGVAPGMVIVKAYDGAGYHWDVWHRSLSATTGKMLYLDSTVSEQSIATGFVSAPTSNDFTVGSFSEVNDTGKNFVAYLFAHDTGTDGIIQCGSFTTDGSGNATVTLGFEPQYVMWKIATGGTESWYTMDSARGMSVTGYNRLNPNTSAAEDSAPSTTFCAPNATGFRATNENPSSTYIYLAIRRPNKPPTVGTQVYNAIARTGTGAAATVTGVGFAPDAIFSQTRSGAGRYGNFDRLRGKLLGLRTASIGAEASYIDSLLSFDMDGYSIGSDSADTINSNTFTFANWCFRRAPGVFDQVCYTGTGAAHTEAHNLGVVPELMIVKKRSAADDWYVYAGDATDYLVLNSTAATADLDTIWNDTAPTSSVFTVGTNDDVNQSTATFVAYLFATKAGISKVGSYTGNGTNQTINCGFTTGARFVLIKRTDSTGDWFVWDSVRGIIAGNDPHLSLNTTAAEVTTDDSIDPDTSGFIVNQDAATDINVTSASYIYLSLA